MTKEIRITKPGWEVHAFRIKQRTSLPIPFGTFSSFELCHSVVIWHSSFVIN
jgi:hypothetical protein